MGDYKAIVKLLERNTGARRMSNVFDDFIEMFALAIRNTVDYSGRDAREEKYVRIAGQYTREQLDRFAEAFALVVMAMEEEPRDVLGHLYMQLELGSDVMGQFYTPYDIARLLAEMQGDALVEQVETRGFASVYEPACGAGAFMVATSEAFRARGYNPQTQLHVTAEDLSSEAVHMIYIHLSLLHVPAVVFRRDTLSMETFDRWVTPAHVLGGWESRLRAVRAVESVSGLMGPAESVSVWDDVFSGLGVAS